MPSTFTYLVVLHLSVAGQEESDPSRPAFYLPENPRYTIVDSMIDSVRFTLTKTLKSCDKGHLASISSFVDPEGNIMEWHDFGNLEGPGWAANAVGGAYEIYALGDLLGKSEWKKKALEILDHVLDHGFIDYETGFLHGYRETTTNRLCLNYKHNSDWFCPGSMAKVAYQLLIFAHRLKEDSRAPRMRGVASRCAAWIEKNVQPVPNGWYPRRCKPGGEVYKRTPEGGNDYYWQTSADGLFILQLQSALTERGLADYKTRIGEKAKVFLDANGIFGSINHDTYDANESVAYAVAFRTLLAASEVLDDAKIRRFAYDRCLEGLQRFKMHEDRNGVKTNGLLYMENTWDTAYLWENAEAALAYFEAAVEIGKRDPQRSRRYESDGLTILRSISKHHHGPHGFLTEGVDWNNHVSQKHHVGQAYYGDIRYTEPFLNNQHIVEPTLYYLWHLATVTSSESFVDWRDLEGNVILRLPKSSKKTESTRKLRASPPPAARAGI